MTAYKAKAYLLILAQSVSIYCLILRNSLFYFCKVPIKMGSRPMSGCPEHHKMKTSQHQASQVQKVYNLNASFKFILRGNPIELLKYVGLCSRGTKRARDPLYWF